MRYLLSIFLLIGLFGCSPHPKPEPVPVSEAHQNLITKIQENLHATAVIQQVDTTLWIYIPLEESLIALKGTKDGPMMVKEVSEKDAVRFIDCNYIDGSFVIDYEVGPERRYPKSFGYASSYSDRFTSLQQGLYSLVQSNLTETKTDEHFSKPEFVYLIIADINAGIELESLIYFGDFKHMMNAQAEFQKRVVGEVRGHENMIGDKTGNHLSLTPMDISHFLARQIVHRINFKYNRSTFPPTEKPLVEIEQQIKTVLELYNFTDYNKIILNNLEDNSTTTLTADDLQNIQMEGKLIEIKFR